MASMASVVLLILTMLIVILPITPVPRAGLTRWFQSLSPGGLNRWSDKSLGEGVEN